MFLEELVDCVQVRERDRKVEGGRVRGRQGYVDSSES